MRRNVKQPHEVDARMGYGIKEGIFRDGKIVRGEDSEPDKHIAKQKGEHSEGKYAVFTRHAHGEVERKVCKINIVITESASADVPRTASINPSRISTAAMRTAICRR